ncbi:hypothetical protein [Methanosphaera cuniculi]|uniref:hypothetical protein n=1 Tax=Methanosphaera cuniculi TaxID=1077256 RepID=UPI0026EE4483|nr:hypothetical protein [Methanosphaera cuniculi]
MNKKFKILIIILILILIPVVYFTATTISNQMEQDNFYNTIKEVSDNENKSDIVSSEYQKNSSYTLSEIMDNNFALKVTESNSRTLNESIAKLKDLNKSLQNETLKEYVELEIQRMEDEVESDNYYYSGASDTFKALKGEISVHSVYDKVMSDYNKSKEYGNKVDTDKQKVQDFLEKHPDIKNKFEELKNR